MRTPVELLLALLVGAGIGFGFGMIQQAALRRHQALERAGAFRSGWSLLPGSGGRVAMLVIVLALIQIVCPILFVNGTQWWVSAGVMAGYGWSLWGQLRWHRVNGLASRPSDQGRVRRRDEGSR